MISYGDHGNAKFDVHFRSDSTIKNEVPLDFSLNNMRHYVNDKLPGFKANIVTSYEDCRVEDISESALKDARVTAKIRYL